MSASLTTTWHVVTKSRNETVTAALLPLLGSQDPEVVGRCVQALARRRDPIGHRAILARFDSFAEDTQAALAGFPGRMTETLREAVLGKDPLLFKNALCAVCKLDEYEVIPALVRVLESDPSRADWAAATILLLAQHLSEELTSRRRPKDHRDPQRIWGQALSSLQESLSRYATHRRREIAQAYLLLTPRNSKTLIQILSDSKHACHGVLMEILETSCDPQLLGHLLAVVLRSPAPREAREVLGRRCELPFVRSLLGEVAACGEELANNKHGLAHIQHIEWISKRHPVLDELEGPEQGQAVTLAVASGIPRPEVLAFLCSLAERARPQGRREACAALAEFTGRAAEQVVLEALQDECPEVQAAAVSQLRQRDLPDALDRVVEFLASPHDVVREAARTALSDHSVERFRALFDELTDEARCSMGLLVRRVDPSLPDAMRQDLQSKSRAKRLRAIGMAQASASVELLERELIASLEDDDHFIRASAAEALAQCNSHASRAALKAALTDRSVAVQQAARESLEQILTGGEALEVEPLATLDVLEASAK